MQTLIYYVILEILPVKTNSSEDRYKSFLGYYLLKLIRLRTDISLFRILPVKTNLTEDRYKSFLGYHQLKLIRLRTDISHF